LRTTLRLSRFNVRKPGRAKQSWSIKTKRLQHDRKSVGVEKLKDKACLRADFEPVTSLGSYFETYRKIEDDFLTGWLNRTPRNFSMLLYGPPGAGKTSVAENLADALGFRLVTITVSDFLAGGGGEVEARAKMIFEVLEEQANVVILFDEIDELILDRSSTRHEKQDTVFKFMTPGMLTKLNKLRRAQRSIFIIATNYAYRIDRAIRRTGRIDQNYLLLPSDAASRQRMLTGFLREAIIRGKLPWDSELGPFCVDWTGQWERLQNSSFFLGYTDMKSAVDRVVNRGSTAEIEDLERELRNWGRTTTLRLYNRAFDETEDHDAINSEFLPLVEMAAREGKEFADRPWLDNGPLFKPRQTGGAMPFASKCDLKNKALDFVWSGCREHDPK
jgi:cytidylate kinase